MKSGAQTPDSLVSKECYLHSTSNGTNITSISNDNFTSGQLNSTDYFSWGRDFDSTANYVFICNHQHCDVYRDTSAASDSVVCRSYYNGIPTYTNITVNFYDSLSRGITTINYNGLVYGNRTQYQYDIFGNRFLQMHEYFNGMNWVHADSYYNYYSPTNKINIYVYLNNTAHDSIEMRKYFYDANDSLITEDHYSKYPNQNRMYINSRTERDFHPSGKLIEERFYNGDTLALHQDSKIVYYYDTLSSNGLLIKSVRYNTTSAPPSLLYKYDYYYNPNNTYIVYHINCDTVSCIDTTGYCEVSMDPYVYVSTCKGASLQSNGTYYYYTSGQDELTTDSLGRILHQSEFSSNYPPPIYSEFTSSDTTYNSDNQISSTCSSHGGSHINDFNGCCSYTYQHAGSSLQLRLIGDSSTFNCPGINVPLYHVISGGQPPYMPNWNYPVTIDSSGLIAYSSNDTSATYILTVTDSMQNSVSDTLRIKRLYIHTSIDTDSILCPGEAILFNSQSSSINNSFYTLNDTLHVMQMFPFIPTQSGIYSFGLSFVVCGYDTIFSTPKNLSIESDQLNLGNDTMLCTYTSLQISAPAGFASYQWSNGVTTSSTSVMSGVEDTIQLICKVTSLQQCETADTISIYFSDCNSVMELPPTATIIFSRDKRTIEILNPLLTAAIFELTDINGKSVMTSEINSLQKRTFELNLSDGIYFYHLKKKHGSDRGGKFIYNRY
jgi:hypothetical protein